MTPNAKWPCHISFDNPNFLELNDLSTTNLSQNYETCSLIELKD